jgi:type II secretory pathway component PulC
MNSATIQLIIALLPLAEKLVFQIGGKLVELNTSDLTKSEDIVAAFDMAKKEGFPQLTFGA